MLRVLLVFLAGVLVGANLVYFAMTRDRGATAADALQPPVATPAEERGGQASEPAGDSVMPSARTADAPPSAPSSPGASPAPLPATTAPAPTAPAPTAATAAGAA